MNKHLLLTAAAAVMGFSSAFAADTTLEVTQAGGSIADKVWTSNASPVVTVSLDGGAFVTDITEANGSIVMNTACATRTVTIASSDPAYYVSGFSIDVRGVQKDQVTFTCGNVSVTTPSTDGTANFAVNGFTAESTVTFTITPNVAENKKAILDNFKVELTATAPSIYEPKDNNGWTVSASSITEDNPSVTGPYTYAKAIDGDASTYWASSYGKTHPHTFCVDMGAQTKVGGFTYMARQDRAAGSGVDRLNAYKVYVTEEPVAGFDFSAVSPVFEGSLANNQDLQRVEFGTNFTGRYFYLQSQSAINANGSESNCFSMAELTLLQGYASSADAELAKIQEKMDAAIAMGATYKENCPFAAQFIDEFIATIDYTPENVRDFAQAYKITIDEMIKMLISDPLKDAAVSGAASAIGKDTAVSFYQPGQAGWLTAKQKATNQGYNSFNYASMPLPATAWTLEQGDLRGRFYLKSAEGTYAATPQVHYVEVVSDKAEAAQFTFKADEGYIVMSTVQHTGMALGFDGKNDPLEVMADNDGSRGYLWKMTPYAPIETGEPYYCLITSKRNTGKYLADFKEPKKGSYKSSGLYMTPEKVINDLWVVTKGYTEGSVWVKNYATGRYLVDMIANGDTTLLDPVDLQYIASGSDGGFMIHGVMANTNMDADNHDDLVGCWTGGGDGSIWYEELVDMTRGETAEEALDYHFNVGGVVNGAIKAAEAYRNTLPGSAAVVDKAVEELNAITDPEGLQEKVDAIMKAMTDKMPALFEAMVTDGFAITVNNVRRQSLSQANLLAYVDTLFNTITEPQPAALWRVVAGETEGTYMLYNDMAKAFVGPAATVTAAGNTITVAPPVKTAAEAQPFTLTIRDNGTLNFTVTDGSNLLNIDTHGSNLTYWSDANDTGSQWQLSAVDYVEFTEEYPVEFNDVYSDPSVGYAYTYGQSVTSCSLTVEGATAAEWTGLGECTVWIYDMSADEDAISSINIDLEAMTFDAATGTLTMPFTEPMTELTFYRVEFSENAFAFTTAEGKVLYTPEIESLDVFVYYFPEKDATLIVTPEAGEVKTLGTITIDMADATYILVNPFVDGNITLTKNGNEIFSADPETFDRENYNGETFLYDIEANQSEAGTYTLTVPAGFFAADAGYSVATTVVWTITKSGITNVTVTTGENSKIYDLQGRRLNRAVRGINIVDGVKTLIRK